MRLYTRIVLRRWWDWGPFLFARWACISALTGYAIWRLLLWAAR